MCVLISARYGAVFGLVTAAILFRNLDSGTRQASSSGLINHQPFPNIEKTYILNRHYLSLTPK